MMAHHYWTAVSRSSAAGRAVHLGHASVVLPAGLPAWINARLRLRCRSPYAGCLWCTLGWNSFVSSAYFFALPAPDDLVYCGPYLGWARTDGCMPLVFEIVC